MESYCTDLTYIYIIISKNLPTIPTPSMRSMLGSGTELVGRFRLFLSVRYYVLPGAVWCGAMHTFSHTPESTIRHKDCHLFLQEAAASGMCHFCSLFKSNLFCQRRRKIDSSGSGTHSK